MITIMKRNRHPPDGSPLSWDVPGTGLAKGSDEVPGPKPGCCEVDVDGKPEGRPGNAAVF